MTAVISYDDAMQPVPVDPRQAAAFAAAVIAALLVLQWAHRRMPFILVWAAGWLLIVPAMLLIPVEYGPPLAGRAAVGASQLLGILTAALFLWSADLYRQTGFVRARRLKALAPIAAWFLVAPLGLGVGAVLAPGYLITAVLLAAAGSMYGAVLIERRMIGAGLIAFVLLGLAISKVTQALALSHAIQLFSLEILVVNAVLFAFAALGIHLLVFEDMTWELRAANRRLEAAREELVQAAITDALTGCHNRRFLDTVAGRELRRHERFALPLSLLYVDVNRFKQINDTLGHEAGDRVLQYVARFLKRHIREADYVFRLGGDEFLVLITCTGEEARRKAAVLKASFDSAPDTEQLPPGVGLSVGSIEVPAGTKDLTPLVRAADERMYEDKGASRPPAPWPRAAPRPRQR